MELQSDSGRQTQCDHVALGDHFTVIWATDAQMVLGGYCMSLSEGSHPSQTCCCYKSKCIRTASGSLQSSGKHVKGYYSTDLELPTKGIKSGGSPFSVPWMHSWVFSEQPGCFCVHLNSSPSQGAALKRSDPVLFPLSPSVLEARSMSWEREHFKPLTLRDTLAILHHSLFKWWKKGKELPVCLQIFPFINVPIMCHHFFPETDFFHPVFASPFLLSHNIILLL